MPRVDGPAARRTMLEFRQNVPGFCLRFVWLAYAAHGATSAQSYPTAWAAWQVTTMRHTDMNPPEGKPIWLGRRHRDGNMHGDVFIAGAGGRNCAATDYPSWGKIGTCTIAQRIAQTGREYLGWTDDFLGNIIEPFGTDPEPEPDDGPTPANRVLFLSAHL